METNEHNTSKIIAVLDIENKSYNTFISLEYFQSLMYFNIKYIKLHCANRARFLLTICHRIALRETCATFGNNLSSDNVMQRYAMLGFCFWCNLLSDYVRKTRAYCWYKWTGFVTNL